MRGIIFHSSKKVITILLFSGLIFFLACTERRQMKMFDSAEQMLALDNEPSCSDSWASALIAELDQFKSEKNVDKNTKASSMELDLMDDFLEMERLAALPEASATGPSSDHHSGSDQAAESSPSKAEFQHVTQRTAELEERIERMEHERI